MASKTYEEVVADDTTEQKPIQLELNDIAIALHLIEIGISRGAYQPRELATVGKTHEKIQVFLEQQAEQVKKAQLAQAQTEEEAND